MDIQVGEYVRTNRGVIAKLIRIERDDIDTSLKWYVLYDGKNERYINKPYIVKNSKNIVDLIELYDYVNGMLVFDIITYDNGEKALKLNSGYLVFEDEIETILTKEQYEANCYRLEA